MRNEVDRAFPFGVPTTDAPVPDLAVAPIISICTPLDQFHDSKLSSPTCQNTPIPVGAF
jgi:hypothetical protein